MEKDKKKILSGIAGEYLVAGELSRRGYIASVTLKNTAEIDVLASSVKKVINIQVKTRCIERADGWDLGNKPLKYEGTENNIFYVLVELHSDPSNKEIGYYIIPNRELNKRVEDNFQDWKKIPKRNGKPKISDRRIFRMKEYPDFQTIKYKENWDMLFN